MLPSRTNKFASINAHVAGEDVFREEFMEESWFGVFGEEEVVFDFSEEGDAEGVFAGEDEDADVGDVKEPLDDIQPVDGTFIRTPWVQEKPLSNLGLFRKFSVDVIESVSLMIAAIEIFLDEEVADFLVRLLK